MVPLWVTGRGSGTEKQLSCWTLAGTGPPTNWQWTQKPPPPYIASMTDLAFIKMHGLGNDFVVLDARTAPIDLGTDQIRAIADRKFGVGCDQLITLEPSDKADLFMRIHNADGIEVEACGNATRCIGALLAAETGRATASVDTVAGLLITTAVATDRVTVDMGPARLDWREIPLAREMDTLHVDFAHGGLNDPVAVNMGNPHLVFFVDDVAAVDLERLGPEIEHHELFPDRINVNIAQVRGPGDIRHRVWERGVGITRACGTGACATLVAASRRGHTDRAATIELDGGPLDIAWREDGHVLMTGATATSFRGVIDRSLLNGAGC